jgi:hypothetical protein
MDSYKKGMAIKEVNINARAIIDDITQTVANAPPVGFDYSTEFGNDDNTYGTIGNPEGGVTGHTGTGTTWYVSVRTDAGRTDGGILCTGNYSYIWKHADRLPNSWRFGQAGDSVVDGDTGRLSINGRKDFRLVKVRDASRTACKVNNLTAKEPVKTAFSSADDFAGAEFVELLTNNEMDLALYDFKAFTPATSQSNGQTFYGFSFILGTIRGVDRDVDRGGIISNESCTPPQSYKDSSGHQVTNSTDWESSQHAGSDFNYCSINKFNFSARSSGAVLKGSS